MMKDSKNIKDIVDGYLAQVGMAVVLQGIDPRATGFEDVLALVDIPGMLANPLQYFIGCINRGRRIYLYEEYFILHNFFTVQFHQIIILKDNLYMNLTPIYAPLSPEIRDALQHHFAQDEENDDISLAAAETLLPVYAGYTELLGSSWGVYTEAHLEPKESIEYLYEDTGNLLDKGFHYVPDEDPLHIFTEEDFVGLICQYRKTHAFPTIRIEDYTGNKEELQIHLHILENITGQEIRLAEEKSLEPQFLHRQAYADILRKYWGYDNFRTFPVYDLRALQHGEKKVKDVSQEEVIASLVEQVERCGKHEQPRDLFVTASTGSGKSVMFQIPAIYLARKPEKLLTIVISPLIGLMNDQVQSLEKKNYGGAKTINSDISPVLKQSIMEKVKDGTYDILYISPETLLGRSDVEQLVGDRTIGMIVIDEAHIVTTWGKQFRPDYWYLGDHIRKLRKRQIERKKRDLVVATFTATAIYHGREDMYEETIDSLHMIEPITYLGYVRRRDIEITIRKMPKKTRNEYELDKFTDIENLIKGSVIMEKKTLVYFPTVKLIQRFEEYLESNQNHNGDLKHYVVSYHGQMDKMLKQENYERFLHGERPIMLATKAFGMGIDIDNIERVIHFAPTGNVCDYVQEIGRAARKPGLEGEAIYDYESHDFKHINRLQGLSAIKKYQLVGVIKKIEALYQRNRRNRKKPFTRKSNAMLLDAKSFTYLFGNPLSDDNDNINKVKTALLMIQKDFEKKRGFSPIMARPVPMFATGYFSITKGMQTSLKHIYHTTVKEVDALHNICSVNLENIWKQHYQNMSFPRFKYLLYSRDESLPFNQKYELRPAYCVDLAFDTGHIGRFQIIWKNLQDVIYPYVTKRTYVSSKELALALKEMKEFKEHPYWADNLCEIVLSSMDTYNREVTHSMQRMLNMKPLNNGQVTYQFLPAIRNYFRWGTEMFRKLKERGSSGKLYLTELQGGHAIKEANIALGVFEAMDVLDFNISGGDNSQIYVYINQEQALQNIVNNPNSYHNSLLEEIAARHKVSVQMLTYIFNGDFSSDKIWDLLEDYFLGKVPAKVQDAL